MTVKVPDHHVRRIWEQECESGGFAVNGELTERHWSAQMALFYELNPSMARVTREAVIAGAFVRQALNEFGTVAGADAV